MSDTVPQFVSAAYLTMNWAGWVVLVPLAVASLLTGVTHGLVTPWGLLRHYCVIVKLVLTITATTVLLAYTRTLAAFAEVATRDSLRASDLDYLRNPSVVLHSTAALLILLTATILAIYKPAGMTRRGHRLRDQARLLRGSTSPRPAAGTK